MQRRIPQRKKQPVLCLLEFVAVTVRAFFMTARLDGGFGLGRGL